MKNLWRDELQFIRDPMEAFRVSEKQVSAGGQASSQGIDYFDFCFPLKIDQHVAAENQVKRTRDNIGLASEIETVKPDDLAKFVDRLDFAFLRTEALQKEPSLIFERNALHFLNGPDAGGRFG